MSDVPADFERRRRYGGQLGRDGEDTVEFAVGEGLRHFGGDAGEDSVGGSVIDMGISEDGGD